ncbi:hypothetical protein BN7_2260 [Wickerhamomyces ciferrii]|uniref:Leucine-rich repeat-containing protein n=1 Tax=Wickerhamomyces ciferrii (strain ATCC 14091 / BCRC 22168 / CBS 111 / JCM 3599 / NBRC 0793 / NRRL Y-1031 F-60-10) TaxID=1206466 RepID=K0KI85_WICCF|nr:uncharacterized protein BN7_2260 [Wickerhamomyces ciferrii]CCH42716.1 hypothetical protein BN7_2260 [Wickerhamomyces ciferrii]
MEKQNPLLPFWYDLSRPQHDNALDPTPRDRATRDENAGGTMFHTRQGEGSAMIARKRVHDQEDGDSKRRTFALVNNNSDQLTSDTDIDEFEGNFPRHSKHYSSNHIHKTSSHPSYPSHPSSESVYFFQNNQNNHIQNQHNQRVPSSPPLNHQLASSPVNYNDYNQGDNDIFTSQATMVAAPKSDFDIDEEQVEQEDELESNISEDTIDFNITNLNRVHGYISSDNLHEEPEYYNNIDEEELNFKARIIIAKAIEDGNPQIRLDNIGLRNLPDDMEDLKNMITVNASGIVKPNIEVYASHNRLRVLPPSFFNVENVIVLSLRNNKMKKLTGKISKFQKLTDLSLASNELKVLPYQILNLPNLTNFLVRPNHLLWELKNQEEGFAKQVSHESPNQDINIRRYVSKLKWSDLPIQSSSQLAPPVMNDRQMCNRVSAVPKLSELSLRSISHYKVSLSETKMWKKNVPTYIQKMIAKAIQKGAYEESCSVCEKVTVNPVAKSLEWWDIKTQKLVPLVRKFCCGNCVKQWLDEIDEAVTKFQMENEEQREDQNEYQEDVLSDMRSEDDIRFDDEF